MIHELKCRPPYFNDVRNGIKTFEIRNDDRHFSVGDRLVLEEFDPGWQEKYTGRRVSVDVVYKVDGGQFGIAKGYCVLGVRLHRRATGGPEPTTAQQAKGMPRGACGCGSTKYAPDHKPWDHAGWNPEHDAGPA